MPTIREDFDSSEYESGSKASKTLTDISAEAFLLIFHVNAGNDPGHPEDLRKSIGLLFQELERQGKRHGHGEEDIKAARYALCSLIDETLLNSRWAFKTQWAERPLQLDHFGEHMAGERFFDLLERIRQKGRRKVDLLETFCMCLLLGFQGKYKMGGSEELTRLTRALVEEVNGHRGGNPSLSPHWKIPDEPADRPASGVPRWALVVCAASVLLVILVFAILKLWLTSQAGAALRQMNF
jgi:type VI secretion system protein ImpK